MTSPGLFIENVGVDELERLGLDKNVLDFVRGVSTFFQNYPTVPIAKTAGALLFFPVSEVEIVQPVFDQVSGAEKAVSSFDKRALAFVYKNPQLAPYVLSKAKKDELTRMMRGKKMPDMMGAVLLAGSWGLFRQWCLDNTIPVENNSSNRKKLEKVVAVIESSRRLTDFTAMGTEKFSFAHGIDQLVSATAFAVAPSEIYAGTDMGLISISFDAEGFPVLRTELKCGVSGVYSLCYVLGRVYVIGSAAVERIHPRTGDRRVMNRPQGLAFPTITDGRYFYSVSVDDERCVKITKFVLNDEEFVNVGALELDRELPMYDATRCCFATDGAVLSVLPWGSTYEMYSLVNGRHLKKVPCLRPLRAWSIQPYTLDHCILTTTDFVVVQNSLHTPRWLEGYEAAPIRKGDDVVLYEAHLAVYHGVNLFRDYSDVTALFNHFLVRKNAPGIYMMGHICVEMSEDLTPCLPYMMDRWQSDPSLRRFLLYVYLAWLSRTTVTVNQNSIVNLYLEKEKDLEIIWSFHALFNFKRFPLSSLATSNLLTYVIRNWDRFPALTGQIILGFCAHKVRYCMVPDQCEQMVPHFRAIVEHIRVNLRMVLDGMVEERWFRDSTQFGILQYLLVLIRKYQEVWYIIGLDFLKMLDFAFYKRRHDMPEIERALDCALVLFFEILRTIPRPNTTVTYPSFDEFAKVHPHPLNGVRRDLDDKLLALINMSHDIHTGDQFAAVLFKCRRYLMFEDPDAVKLLPVLSGRFAAEKIIDYLRSGDIRVVETIRDPDIMEWVVSVFRENAHSLTTKQKYILTLYIELLTDNLIALTMKDNSGMYQLLTTNNVLFLINPKVMLKTKLAIKAANVMRMDVREMQNSQKSIAALFHRITNGNHFLDGYLGAKEADFLVASGKQKIYKAALLCLIAVKGGAVVDLARIEQMSCLHVKWGSDKVVELVMKMVAHLEERSLILREFYACAMDILSTYFHDGVNPFVCQEDEFLIQASIFTVVAHLKKMFNLGMGFTNFLNEFIANVKSEREAVSVFVVLNNTFEAVRRGVNIHYLDSAMKQMAGECVKFDPVEGVVVLKTGVKTQLGACGISESKNIWCACKVMVNLSRIKSLEDCYRLFTKYPSEHEVNKAFMLAAFLEFCRLDGFRALLTVDHVREIASTDLSTVSRLETHYFDFMQFSAMSRLQIPAVSFTEANQTRTLKTHSPKVDGTVTALAENQVFNSSPIHPDTAMAWTFTVMQQSAATIRLHAVSKVWNTALDGFDVEVPAAATDTFVDVEFNPSTGLITASVNGVVQHRLKNPGGVTFYWIQLDVAQNSIVRYKATYEPSWRRRACHFEASRGFLTPSTTTPVPGSDSSLFNRMALSEAADVVRSALSALIFVEVMADHARMITDDRFFALMSLVHVYPFDEVSVIQRMNLAPLWRGYEKHVHALLVRELIPERLQSLTSELKNRANTVKSAPLASNSALYLETDQFIVCSNAFIANQEGDSPMNLIGFNETPIKVEYPVCLIPLDDCVHSVVSYALDLLHLFMVSVALKAVDTAKLTSIGAVLKRDCPALTSIVKHTLDLVQVTAPASVAPTDFSFLVPFSVIFADAEKRVVPALEETEFKDCAGEIAEQLQRWRPYHSHQLFCAEARELTKDVYDGLPLSSEFSFDTARFVWAILGQPDTTELFIIGRHFLPREGSLQKKPSLSRTGALFSFSSWSEQTETFEPSSEFSFYRKLADTASLNGLRIGFLKSRIGHNLFTLVDPDTVRIEYQGDKINGYVAQAKQEILAGTFLRASQECDEVTWLKRVVASLGSFVFIQFQEWVTGRWGTLALENGYGNICILFSGAPEHAGKLLSYRPECLVIVGKHKSEKSLKRTLLQNIQMYEDEYNVGN